MHESPYELNTYARPFMPRRAYTHYSYKRHANIDSKIDLLELNASIV